MYEISCAQVFESECQLSEPIERLRLGHGPVTPDPFRQVAAGAVLENQIVVTVSHLRREMQYSIAHASDRLRWSSGGEGRKGQVEAVTGDGGGAEHTSSVEGVCVRCVCLTLVSYSRTMFGCLIPCMILISCCRLSSCFLLVLSFSLLTLLMARCTLASLRWCAFHTDANEPAPMRLSTRYSPTTREEERADEDDEPPAVAAAAAEGAEGGRAAGGGATCRLGACGDACAITWPPWPRASCMDGVVGTASAPPAAAAVCTRLAKRLNIGSKGDAVKIASSTRLDDPRA